MESNIEIIYSQILVDNNTFAPTMSVIWKDNDGNFFEFNMRISREYQQDLGGVYKDIDDRIHLIIHHPESNKEVTLEYLINMCKDSQMGELNKKILPYIRNEKLNKLVN